MKFIGKSIPRIDAEIKVTGHHVYPSDYYEPGTLLLGLVRSEIPHGLIKSIHLKDALEVEGVETIFTAKDIDGTNRYGVVHKDQEVLVEKKVRYIGDPICLVAARDKRSLEEAISKIKVEYEPLPSVFDPFEALKPDAPKIHEKGNLLQHTHIEKGDVKKGEQEADIIVEGTYEVPFIDHTPMETEAGFAKMEGDKVIIWAGTQTPFRDRGELALALGLPEEKIRVIAPFFGGGFGRKDGLTIQPYLALAALKLKKPVKMFLSREESVQGSYHRHKAIMKYRTGAKKDGTLTFVRAELYFDTGAYASFGGEVMSLGVEHYAGPYFVPNGMVDGYAVYTNNIIGGAMRGFGVPQVTFAFESQMDRVAEKLGMDPWEIRYKNAIKRGDTTGVGNTLIYSTGIRESLKLVKESSLWKNKDQLLKTDSPFKKRGIGIACSYQGGGLGVGIPDFAEAKIELLPDGRYRVYGGISDMGQGNISTYVQIAAEELSAPIEQFEYTFPDTDRTLDSGPSSASRTTYIYSKALIGAIRILKDNILKKAKELLGREDVTLLGDKVYSPEKSVSLSEVWKVLEENERIVTSYVDMPLSKDRRDIGYGLPHIVYAFSTHLALVEVDTLTGELRVIRYVSATDVGKILNKKVLEGQVEGGVAQGIGAALTEEVVLKEGKVLNSNFTTYNIPGSRDLPDIETLFVGTYEPTHPYGMKGAGEINVDAPPAAIGNAIFNACGIRITSTPFTPVKILKALENKA